MTLDELAASLQKAVRETPEKTSAALRKTAYDIQGDAQQRARYKTGALKGSISVEVIDQLTVVVGPTAEYGRIIEEGSNPHIIVPKKAKALYFNGIFTSRVSHPGTKPYPYMMPAVDKMLPNLFEACRQIVEGTVNG